MSETNLNADPPDLRKAAEAACEFLQTLGRPLFISSGLPMVHALHGHSEALRAALISCAHPVAGTVEARHAASPSFDLRPDDLCTIVGVKSDGTEVELGEGPIQPRSKAVELLRSYGFTDLDGESSDGHYALMAIEELLSWMVRIGWKSPPVLTRPSDALSKACELLPASGAT